METTVRESPVNSQVACNGIIHIRSNGLSEDVMGMSAPLRALASYTHVGRAASRQCQLPRCMRLSTVVVVWRHFSVVDADPRISVCAPVGAH